MLKPWLKAGYVESGQNFPTDQGAPQGGLLSPCLLVFALRGRLRKSSSAKGLHLHALTDRDVNLSIHRALIVQPLSSTTSVRTALAAGI
jgi:hypothetical protein